MENVTLSDTIQPVAHGPFTQHDIVLSRAVSVLAQSILFGVFAVTYWTARSALKDANPLRSVEKRNLVYLWAITGMFVLAFANLSLTFKSMLQPAAGYQGKLDAAYKTFADKYFLFMSVNAMQYYLYVTQTMIADGLLTYILYLKSNGNPKAYGHAALSTVLGTLFGYCASGDSLWAFQFLVFTALGINFLSSGPMMQAHIRDSDIVKNWEWRSRSVVNLLRSQEFRDAAIQSAAVYSIASFSLPVTFLMDTNILFYANMCALSPLMGIAFSLAVIDPSHNSSNNTNQLYTPYARQSQGRPPMPDTVYMPLTASLDRSPELA